MVALAHRMGLSQWINDETRPPAPRTPIVHLAGTKGKGSTATLVASALTAAGYRTGTYTSPHLHRLEERFRVDGTPCSPQQLVELVDALRPVCDGLADNESSTPIGQPTFFELTTAMALLHFQRQGCDAMVIEVGLGGRLDSTNVIAPAVTAITSIGMDHQHVLGDTKSAIAREKAGIIKVGVPVISGVTEAGPRLVIQQTARDQKAPLFCRDHAFSVTQRQLAVGWGSTFSFRGHADPLVDIDDVHLSLEGAHQVDNAAVAIAILQTLTDQGRLQIDQAAIKQAFANISMPARIEKYLLDGGVLAIIDAAHNEDSTAALIQSLEARQMDSRKIHSSMGITPGYPLPTAFVFGTSIDKDASSMLRQIIPHAETLVLTRFHGNPRFTPTRKLKLLAEAIQQENGFQGEILVQEDPVSACRQARRSLSGGGRLVVCGSFFLAAEVGEYFHNEQVGQSG